MDDVLDFIDNTNVTNEDLLLPFREIPIALLVGKSIGCTHILTLM